MNITSCYACGRDSTTPLCPRCERSANSAIRSGLSATGQANRACPACKGGGSLLTKVQTRDGLRYGKLHTREEMRKCPTCFGLGHIAPARAEGSLVEVVPSDIGLTKRTLSWRRIKKVGAINGLPRFAGTAFATDGILVAIERDDRSVVIGHLDSFIEVKPEGEAPTKGKRLSKWEKLAMEFS